MTSDRKASPKACIITTMIGLELRWLASYVSVKDGIRKYLTLEARDKDSALMEAAHTLGMEEKDIEFNDTQKSWHWQGV